MTDSTIKNLVQAQFGAVLGFPAGLILPGFLLIIIHPGPVGLVAGIDCDKGGRHARRH